MCGIAGFFDPTGGDCSSPELMHSMLGMIRHRGPDESGYFIDDCAGVGTTRLSIIDLSGGSQPISDSRQRYWICFNGELYNYREIRADLEREGVTFRTASDTEVVLQAWIRWGDRALPGFNGAFAFAIYDSTERSLVLVRDRFGKRPLYYLTHNGVFYFASELKCFFAIAGFSFEFDRAQLASIYTLWTPLPEQTGFCGVDQLAPGTVLTQRADGFRTNAYHTLDFSSPVELHSEGEAVEALREALQASVSLRLRSDVEVGIYLSGGLDSTVVTDLVTRESTQPVQTFSIAFEEASYDESTEQQLIHEWYGTRHTELRIGARDLVEALPAAVFHAEVPVFRTAFVPMFLLSRKVHDAGIKVVLSGEGADEAFLGYNIFRETLLRLEWNRLEPEHRRERLSRMYPYLNHYTEANRTALMSMYQHYTEERIPGLFSHELRFQGGGFCRRLLNEAPDGVQPLLRYLESQSYYSRLSPIEKAQWLEFRTLLAGYLLSTQGERMSMAHGVENRCPFLDPNVVALSHAVNLKFDDGFQEKMLIKKAFEDRVPPVVLNKPKQPYRAPDLSAFRMHRPEYLELLLSGNELKKIGILDSAFCQKLVSKLLSESCGDISQKESHAFMFLVTTALLHHQYVERRNQPSLMETTYGTTIATRIDRRRHAA